MSSFSTLELPIRKYIKLVLIVASIGAATGITFFAVTANSVGMFKPDAPAILGNALWTFHAAYPLLFAVYLGFGAGTYVIVRYDRRHQKQERFKRFKEAQDRMLSGESKL